MIGRTIRPRPLSYNERIPVIFLNRPREGDDADRPSVDPALEQFLRNCENEREQNGLLSGLETSRRRRKNRHHRANQQQQQHQAPLGQASAQAKGVADGGAAGLGRGLSGSAPARGSCSCPNNAQHSKQPQQPIGDGGAVALAGKAAIGDAAAAGPAITVPTCREVSDYAANKEAMACADARKAAAEAAGPNVPLLVGILPDVSPCLASQGSLGLDAAAYIIYQDLLRDRRLEPALLQYDMDDEDKEALATINAPKVPPPKPGAASASRTPPTTRAATAAVAAAAAALLDEDGFEALVGALERAHFEALQQRKELWQPDLKSGKVPKLLPTEKILPWEAAVAALKQHQPKLPPLPRALFNHWLKRRKQEGGPLLQYLWYEQPWKAISFQNRLPGHEGEQGDMPFEAAETKNGTRGGWNRIRINKKEAYERLMEVRDEFELLRTTADQVRKRERLKKHLLKLYRAEMAAKLGLNLHSKHTAAAAAASAAGVAAHAGVGAAGGGGAPAPPAHQGPAGTTAAVAAAAGGDCAGGAPPKKRRRIATDAAPPPQKAGKKTAAAAMAAADPPATAVVGAARPAGAKDSSKPRQQADAPRNARVRKAPGGAWKPTAAAPSSPTSVSSASSDSSSSSSSSEDTSTSGSGAETSLDEAGASGAVVIGNGRRPAAVGAGGRGRFQSRAAERPRSGGRRLRTGARGDSEDSSSPSSSADADRDDVSSGSDGSGATSSSSSSDDSGGGGAESSDVDMSSESSSGSDDGDGREESEGDGTALPGLMTAKDASASEEDECVEEAENRDPRQDAAARSGADRRGGLQAGQRDRSRSRSRLRNAGPDKARRHAAANTDDRVHTGGNKVGDSGAGGVETDRKGTQDADREGAGRQGGQRQSRGRESRVGPKQQQHQNARGRARASSQSAAAASASPVRSASRSPAPSSSTTRSSSPTRSGRDRREAPPSSSPELSRSPSPSPPRKQPCRRGSAPAAGAVVVPDTRARHRRLNTADCGGEGRHQHRGARRRGVALSRELPHTGPPGKSAGPKVRHMNRELLSLLRMQRGGHRIAAELAAASATPSGNVTAGGIQQRGDATGVLVAGDKAGMAGGAATAGVEAAAQREGITQPSAAPAGAGAAAEGAARKARGSTGGGAGAAPAPRSPPLSGIKRPLEAAHGGVGGTGTAGSSPSPSHRKSKTGWRKELAALLGKPFAVTSRFLLQRKPQPPRLAAVGAGEPVKARDGASDGGAVMRGSARRTSMLRERNGTAS